MKLKRTLIAGLASVGLTIGAVAPAAQASTSETAGTNPLINVLTADGDTFDRNPYDFDIVTEAAKAVLAAKPNSPVSLLADGTASLTAFIPNDRAFQLLARDLTGKRYGFFRVKEEKVFNDVAALGIDMVESVLLYHVIPGDTITKQDARNADGATLTTAQGGTIEVDVKSRWFNLIRLKDNDPNDRDPYIVRSKFDINKGNEQIAHGISRVLRPADL